MKIAATYAEVYAEELEDGIYEVRTMITGRRLGWITRGHLVGDTRTARLVDCSRYFVTGHDEHAGCRRLVDAVAAIRDYQLGSDAYHDTQRRLAIADSWADSRIGDRTQRTRARKERRRLLRERRKIVEHCDAISNYWR